MNNSIEKEEEEIKFVKNEIAKVDVDIDEAVSKNEERYNVLLTSICGGALLLIFQILKELKMVELSSYQRIVLSASAILFMASIFFNLIIPSISVIYLSKLGESAKSLKD